MEQNTEGRNRSTQIRSIDLWQGKRQVNEEIMVFSTNGLGIIGLLYAKKKQKQKQKQTNEQKNQMNADTELPFTKFNSKGIIDLNCKMKNYTTSRDKIGENLSYSGLCDDYLQTSKA